MTDLPPQISLWIDDERESPPEYNYHARTFYAAEYVVQLALDGKFKLSAISFDHDLADTKSGYDIACMIESAAHTGRLPRLAWDVHSMNTVGAARIRMAMESADKAWNKSESQIPTT